MCKGTKEYSFDAYKHDLNQMTDNDIVENMGAELYKLNDINRQKSKTMKWTIGSFATALVSAGVIGILFLISSCIRRERHERTKESMLLRGNNHGDYGRWQ